MVQKVRVLHILGELKPSGAECMLRVAAKNFAEHGIDTEILSTGTEHVGAFASALREVGYAVHHIPFSKSILFFIKVSNLIRLRHYDVVHIHSERANFWFGLSAKLAGVRRIVSTVHAIFAFQGWLRLRRMLFRRLQEKLGVIRIAISPSVRENEQLVFGSSIDVVPNWYDHDHFRPPTPEQRIFARARLGIADGAFAVVSVGNCSKIKNHQAVLEALPLLPNELSVVYLHVGGEETDCPEKQLAQKLGIENIVRFLGQLQDPLPILHAADAYVMPSINEGFGIAALEALAVGLPSILSDVPGLRDFGLDYPNIHYCKLSPVEIATSISDLAELDLSTRQQMTIKYSEISKKKYGIDIGVRNYSRLYQRA